MGYQNVNRAREACRGRLKSVNALLVLLKMAEVSLDDDDPPLYFGRWETLAEALGKVPDRPSSEQTPLVEVGRRKTLLNAVTTAQATLNKAGLIAVVKAKSPGHPTRWALKINDSDYAETSGTDETEKRHQTRGGGGKWHKKISPDTLGIDQSRDFRSDSPETSGPTVPEASGQEEQEGSIKSQGNDQSRPEAASIVEVVEGSRAHVDVPGDGIDFADSDHVLGFLDESA